MKIRVVSETIVSKREKEILQLFAEGLTAKEIADKLYISPHTVSSHRQNLQIKLNVKNSFQLGVVAVKLKILE